MSATATPRIKPHIEVLPNPEDTPDGYAVVAPIPLPVYAGHWGKPGTTHAGMWVMSFSTEIGALTAAHRLRQLGHAS
jgi:hypothetical protein